MNALLDKGILRIKSLYVCHLYFILFIFIACGKKQDPPKQNEYPRINELSSLFEKRLIESRKIRDQDNGWITNNDCDGMIWSGKYGSILCSEVNIEAAETEPGKFTRRPKNPCWQKDSEHNESKTTWSKDMAIAGLYPYILKCNRLDIIEKHIKYGESNNWIMGEPLADGRAIYTPQLIGLSYAIRRHLGGDDNPMIKIPKIWPSNLKDYQAHLQIMAIWIESIMGDISIEMFDRIKEHSLREWDNPFYQYMLNRYSGIQENTINLLLDEKMPIGSYVRCNDIEKCKLSEWLFISNLIIEDSKK